MADKLQVFVDVHSITRFTEEHLEIVDKLIPTESRPQLYSNDFLPPGVEHSPPRQLIDIKSLENDLHGAIKDQGMQTARQSSNPQEGAIRSDIDMNGFSLAEDPIAIRRYRKNGKGNWLYSVIEGRTRLKYLSELGITNFIADVYAIEDDADYIRISQILNNQKKPFGAGKPADFKHTLRQLVHINAIDFGDIKLDENISDADRSEVAAILGKELDLISVKKVTDKTRSTIINDVIQEESGVEWVRQFKDEDAVKDWLESNGFHSGKDIEYIPLTPGGPGMIAQKKANIRGDKEYDPQTQYRLVLYLTAPKAESPENDWKTRTIKMHENYMAFERNFMLHMGITGKDTSPDNISLWGSIPQVRDMHSRKEWDRPNPFKLLPWERSIGISR